MMGCSQVNLLYLSKILHRTKSGYIDFYSSTIYMGDFYFYVTF